MSSGGEHTGPGHAYAAWIDRHRRAILALSVVLAIAGGVLSSKLPLRADLSNLLPPSARSVQDLELLKKRARAFGTVFVVVESDDPALREEAARKLYQNLQTVDPELIANIEIDDAATRDYVWKNRFLFADTDELVRARDAIKEKIRRAKLEANPLFVDLDDEEDTASGDAELDARVEELEHKLEDAEKEAKQTAGFVSEDGRLQLVIVRSTFPSSDANSGKSLVGAIHAAVAQTRMELGGGVTFGTTGNVVTILDEQRSVMQGLWLAAIITVLLCAIALYLYFRSLLPVAASLWSLAVGTLVTFGIAKLAIGHLNLVTAFLAAIVVGNGINAGLILLARYFEEVRAGTPGNDGLGGAIVGAARGTLAASLTAGVAYGSLIVTDFHGFRHFGVIGALGMFLCWIAAFTILPAALCELRHRGRIRSSRVPGVGPILARLLPRRLGALAAAGAVVVAIAGVLCWRYIASNPMQEDWRDLRPQGKETKVAVDWLNRIETGFGGHLKSVISGPFAIAVDKRDEVPPIVAKLRTLDQDKPEPERLLAWVRSMDDLLPTDQDTKLPVLAEIREMIDSDLADELDSEDQETLARVRPPDDLRKLTDDDIPAPVGWMFIERDGSRGRLILAANGDRFESWNVHHWMEIADGVRALHLPKDAVLGGKAFVFSDMITAMNQDGPKATIVALVGAILCVWLIVGLRRHGVVTLMCGFAGIIGMIALVSLWGIKVNVIDFIALPITVGIGIDYAVNIAARDRHEPTMSPHELLRTTGGAVLLCSFTTIVGYGSLLLSDSGGIRSFGMTAILGEFACVIAALAFAPALLAVFRRRDRGHEPHKSRMIVG